MVNGIVAEVEDSQFAQMTECFPVDVFDAIIVELEHLKMKSIEGGNVLRRDN